MEHRLRHPSYAPIDLSCTISLSLNPVCLFPMAALQTADLRPSFRLPPQRKQKGQASLSSPLSIQTQFCCPDCSPLEQITISNFQCAFGRLLYVSIDGNSSPRFQIATGQVCSRLGDRPVPSAPCLPFASFSRQDTPIPLISRSDSLLLQEAGFAFRT